MGFTAIGHSTRGKVCMIEYSLVIPFYNEEENIGPLIQEVESVMNALDKPWELILVNDGSTDQTDNILRQLHIQKGELRILSFDRNYGQSSAFDAGFRSARGTFVITLDGDGQNDPHDIPLLLQFKERYELVCGLRKHRKDRIDKKVISLIANWVRKRICKDGVQDTGCSLKVYRKSCLERIKMFQGMHRFLPALFRLEGFQIVEVPVNHRKRKAGKSKYHFFNRSFNTLADLWAVRWMWKRRLQYKIEIKEENK